MQEVDNWMLQDGLRAALATAALFVSVRGDYENIPSMGALRIFLNFKKVRLDTFAIE